MILLSQGLLSRSYLHCSLTKCFCGLKENDGNKVVREIIHGPCKKKYRYAKVAVHYPPEL